MEFCIVFSGNNYLNEKHDQNIAAIGNNCIDMARAGHTTNPPINSNQLNANAGGHGATASASSSPSTSATPITATSSKPNANMNAIPTTIDGLIEFIAINGDAFEEKILTEITQMNEPTLFR